MDAKELIARRAALEMRDGDVVNLGIGIPALVVGYVPGGIHIVLHSENGIVGTGPRPAAGEESDYVVDAGGGHVSVLPGAAFIDSATSFGIARGGHVSLTVLGALQVDEEGNLANWMIPGRKVMGMGGAMDLVSGARRVIVTMEHTNKGAPKILKRCTLPLTAACAVDTVITEMCVLKVTPEGLLLEEINPDYSLEQVAAATEARLIIPDTLRHMRV